MKFPIRIIATENGNKRELLKITKGSDGGLTLTQKETRLDKPTIPDSHGDAVPVGGGSHISIHPTPQSATTNTIKKTVTTVSGRQPPSYHHTSAIKEHQQFAMVYTRRCSSQMGSYQPFNKTGGTIFDLGSYDPELFTLFIAVFVGPTGRSFLPDHKGLDTNVIHFDTPLFRVTILWSFLSIPAHPIGTIQDFETPADLSTRGVDISEPGFAPERCFFMFRSLRTLLFYELLNILNWDGIPATEINTMAKMAAFYRYGRGEQDVRFVLGRSYRKNVENSPTIFYDNLD